MPKMQATHKAEICNNIEIKWQLHFCVVCVCVFCWAFSLFDCFVFGEMGRLSLALYPWLALKSQRSLSLTVYSESWDLNCAIMLGS